MRGRWRDEAGFVGGFEVLPFGFLVLVVGTLLLVNAWAVFDSHLAASAAAREAVRSFVESEGSTDEARAVAEQVALEAIEGHGKDAGRVTLEWSPGLRLERCEPVTVAVTYEVPTITVPWVGAFGGLLRTTARHTEVVDPYREGLPMAGFVPEACRG